MGLIAASGGARGAALEDLGSSPARTAAANRKKDERAQNKRRPPDIFASWRAVAARRAGWAAQRCSLAEPQCRGGQVPTTGNTGVHREGLLRLRVPCETLRPLWWGHDCCRLALLKS